MKKKTNEIEISFLGTSRNEVTGSCISVSYINDKKEKETILIECGMNQGCPTILSDYNTNKKMVEKIPFSKVSYIFINHVHIDHIGNLACGIKRGFKGKIITTETNKKLMQPLLNDTYGIHEKNVKRINEKGRNIEKLFNKQDTFLTLNNIVSYNENTIHKLNENLSFRFINNNHCVGACQLELHIKKTNGKISKILYTSDMGSNYNEKFKPFQNKLEYSLKSDIAIFESTYGKSKRNFTKAQAIKEREDFISKIKEHTSKNCRVLIPAFSFNRSQMLMCFLYDKLKDDKEFGDTKVVVDSKLINEINEVYREILKGEQRKYWEEVLAWDNFHFIKTYKDTENIVKKENTPLVIISSSGMCNAGHVVSYIKSILPKKDDCIMFVGYCSIHSLGSRIQNPKVHSVKIGKETYEKKCSIFSYKTFSSHIQQDELIEYMKQINTGKILLHHGDTSSKQELQEKAREELFKSNKTTPIEIVNDNNKDFVI